MSIDFTEATDAPVRTPPIVLGEENKVRQVFTNLLGNARRFSPAEGAIEIVVGADRSRGVGTIAIVDHGEGIPPQIREHIFERFWRADTSRARETGGSGLGLPTVAMSLLALLMTPAEAAALPDLDRREFLILAPIAAAVFWMGIYPESFMAPMRGDVEILLERVNRARPESDAQVTAGRPAPAAAAQAAGHAAPAPAAPGGEGQH